MTFTLPDLPYKLEELQPHISRETLEFHWGKHHKTYVENLNKLVPGTPFAEKSLEDIVKTATGGIFNNAAQVWNHTFYWNCLAPRGGGKPKGKLLQEIEAQFGSFEKFQEQFTNAAVTQFGSGWAWLVRGKDGKLAIQQTGNAGNPMTDGAKPLLTCDVWEHAYYIDYRNARAKYVETFWKLVNWDFVERQ